MADSACNANAAAGPLAGTRLWFAAYLLWLFGLATLAQTTFAQYEAGDAAALRVWLFALMCFYMTLCNVFFPLPTSWIILLVASDSVGLFDAAWARVSAVALVGALCTAMANLNEYHVLGYFFGARVGERIRRTTAYAWALRWFDVSPFQTLTLFAFVPIPVDVVRWLAILRRYPRPRFAAAYFCGRTARYALLAALSIGLHLTLWQIVLIQAAIVAALAARLLAAAFRRVFIAGR
jgi:membrane protein YqaA with SNARE-associated domain